MKKAFKAAVVLLFLTILLIINSETNFFLDIDTYIPKLEGTRASQIISVGSEKLAAFTDMIPSPSEIVAFIRHEELPIDPSDLAVNAYITDSPMLSFYPDENISAVMDNEGKKLKIFGISPSKNKQHLVINVCDEKDEQISQVAVSLGKDGAFSKSVTLPSDYKKVKVDIYAGTKSYGEFTSWVYNYIYCSRVDGVWQIDNSPVYDNNILMYKADKSTSEALKSTFSIQSNNSIVKQTAQQITSNCSTDYDKVVAVHDWVCTNIYYDTDNINSTETLPYYATDVLSSKRAVCLGFATLSASLLRSIGIPCNVVAGYALGIDTDKIWDEEKINTTYQNHAWNEAYIDGRWVIFDTTWDCANKIENGVETQANEISHLYFDANIDFFSSNHKILEYMKRK